MFIRKAHWFLILAAVILSTTGCSGDDGTVEVREAATPTPFMSPLSPLATQEPDQGIAPTAVVPEPENGKGTVVGILYDPSKDRPFALQFVYLAGVIEMKPQQGDGEPLLFAELDVSSDPFAQTDENGWFVIENVEPGLYALIVRLPNLVESPLYKAGTGVNVSVELEAGKITDIGTVDIEAPW